MSGSVPPLPRYAFMEWCSVKKHRDNFDDDDDDDDDDDNNNNN
jgi:hypothetical protein